MPEDPEPHDRDLDDNWIKIILDEPLVVYREKISQQSKDFHTKSANRHNRMLMHIEPLDKKTEKLIEEGRIHDLLDVKQRAIILREEAGWDAGEAIQIVDVYNGNILVNGTSGLQRFNRIKSYLSAAFRDFVDGGVLAKEPVTGLKIVFTDLTIHEDPALTGYGQIASMSFSAFSLAMMDAKPHLYEPIHKIEVKIPQITKSGVLAIIVKHRGRVNNVIPEGEYIRVQGQLPKAELIGIADEIRSSTQGRAFFDHEFSRFEKVPGNLEQDLILEIRKRKGMSVEMPNTTIWKRFINKKT